MNRCSWVPSDDQLYIRYHDTEWGVPVVDDKILFEFLILEGAQAGLSWKSILQRKETYKKAFSDWDVKKIAQYSESDINRLMQDPGIIRNKRKIDSAIENARAFMRTQQKYGSFAKYLWKFVDFKPLVNSFDFTNELPAKTELSEKISKDLKKRGFSFVGPTIIYAYMQAVGMAIDHTTNCFLYQEKLKKEYLEKVQSLL